MSHHPEIAKAASAALESIAGRLASQRLRVPVGRLKQVVGPVLQASLPNARVGDTCLLRDPAGGEPLLAEITGFADGNTFLSPFGGTQGLSPDTLVEPLFKPYSIDVGDFLLGRVLDGAGRRIDEAPEVGVFPEQRTARAAPILPLRRPPISQPVETGIRVIDGLLTIGLGQRIGLFGPPGAGKSSLLAAIARNTSADVAVLGLIGERGREVRDFLEQHLPPSVRERCVVVVATSDQPAGLRVLAAHVATAIAEYFRDQGRHVLLLLDSLTRFARAMRDVGLSSGEPPTRRGFTPSVFSELPRLVERSGRTEEGAITGIYTVLTEGDGGEDPIREEVQSLVDGHLVLDEELAQKGHYPAIDVLRSKSRVMREIVEDEHQGAAQKVCALLAKYREVELLLRIGEYHTGNDELADAAVALNDEINAFLKQASDDVSDFTTTVEQLREIRE